MANAFLNFFKEPAPKETIKNQEEISKKYRYFQRRMFYSLYIGYVVSYIGRKNLSMAMPIMSSALSLSNTKLGILNTSFYITYGVGKFVNGILADKSNVRTFFSTALILAALSMYCFAITTSFTFLSVTGMIWLLCFFWGANGWFQSMTFPPIAKSMSYWYTAKERGLKWSFISTSHQIGVICSIAVATYSVEKFGWQAAFYVPGLITMLAGFWLFNRLRDKPTSLGLPEVESYKKSLEAKSSSFVEDESTNFVSEKSYEGNLDLVPDISDEDSVNFDSKDSNEKNENEEVSEDEKLTYMQLLKKYIIFNPLIWIVVLSYLFVYIVRTATEDWLAKYFMESKLNTLTIAGAKVGFFSIVGAFGTILAGVFSDKFFKGRRTPVNLIFLFGLLGSMILFANNKIGALDFVYGPMISFFTAGLQNLVGLYIVELCAKNVASAANGFAGMFSYVGAALSGVGTGLFVDMFGWNGAFIFWIVTTIMAIVLLIIAALFAKKRQNKKTIVG